MIVVWTENAKKDIENYIENSRIIYKEKLQNYINSLINYVNDLQKFERMGKFLFYKNDLEIRQLIYIKHRIFYAVNNDKIYILLVYHTARDVNKIMKYLKNRNYEDLL